MRERLPRPLRPAQIVPGPLTGMGQVEDDRGVPEATLSAFHVGLRPPLVGIAGCDSLHPVGDCRPAPGKGTDMGKAAKNPAKKERKSSGRMASKGFFNPIDVHVGQRIRQRRTLLGLSQTDLGAAIGLTFQQVQKYERGANRVSSSRLFDVARVLDMPLSWFFEEMPGEARAKSPARVMGATLAAPSESEKDPAMRRETLELVRAYYRVPARMRRQLADLVKSLSKTGGEE